MFKRAIFLFIILVGALVGLYFYNKFNKAPEIKFNELRLMDNNNQPFDLNSLKGKNIILCFYASWCGPCNRELKALNAVKNAELPDCEVICISDEPFEQVMEFKESHQYPFTFLKMEQGFEQVKIASIPTAYLFNKKFEIVYEQVGEIEWKDPSTLNHLKSLF